MAKGTPPDSRFPNRIFLLVIGAVCVSLLLSALYGYSILNGLRDQYLRSRAEDVAAFIDLQVRGPRRRPDTREWERTMEEALEAYRPSVAFLALVDVDQNILAYAGSMDLAADPDWDELQRITGLFLYERNVVPSGARSPAPRRARGWRLVIAVYTAPANFIRQAASFHLGASAVAVISLLIVATYFLRTWQRLLEMKTREEAERHLAGLGRMGATLAHEIRNPLGAMKGLTQLVQEQLPEEHESQELISTVVSEAERLEMLVNDLLLFARPRELQLKRIDLAEEVASVKSMLETELDSRGVQVMTGSEPVHWMSDADGLRQVLLNVMRNALEASPAGGTITVKVEVGPKQDFATIIIDDEGPGLAGAEPERLFEPFKTTKTRGTGLGLAISKRIVESLGGWIRLEDRAGGARCTIRLLRR